MKSVLVFAIFISLFAGNMAFNLKQTLLQQKQNAFHTGKIILYCICGFLHSDLKNVPTMLKRDPLTSKKDGCVEYCVINTLGYIKDNQLQDAKFKSLAKQKYPTIDRVRGDMVEKWYQIVKGCFTSQWTEGKTQCQKAADFYQCSIDAIQKGGYDKIKDFNL